MTGRADVPAEIRRLTAEVGVRAWVHARRLGAEPEELDHAGAEPVPMASLYKLPLAACWADLVDTGALDPRARTRLDPADRTSGPTGVAALMDTVELSARDAVRSMLSVSDNAAADAILETIGLERLAAWLAAHGLSDTAVRHGTQQSWAAVVAETGGGHPGEAPARLARTDVDITTSEYDAALASATTARDLVHMLDLLWSQPRYALVRDAMRLQPWRHRIGSGFPHDDVVVHGKTGTLGRLRHEAAVIHFPGEDPVAVAVLTKSARAEIHQPRVDAAIGRLARVAVTSLRRALP